MTFSVRTTIAVCFICSTFFLALCMRANYHAATMPPILAMRFFNVYVQTISHHFIDFAHCCRTQMICKNLRHPANESNYREKGTHTHTPHIAHQTTKCKVKNTESENSPSQVNCVCPSLYTKTLALFSCWQSIIHLAHIKFTVSHLKIVQ